MLSNQSLHPGDAARVEDGILTVRRVGENGTMEAMHLYYIYFKTGFARESLNSNKIISYALRKGIR